MPKPVKFKADRIRELFQVAKNLPSDEELQTAGTFDYEKVDDAIDEILLKRLRPSTRPDNPAPRAKESPLLGP